MIYFGLIALILVQHILITKRSNTPAARKLYLWLCGIELFLFLGFRSVSSGFDNLNYAQAFKLAAEGSWYPNPVPWMEYPFILCTKALSLFATHPQILFLASSAFIVYAGMRLIYKYTTLPWLGVFTWLTFGKIMFEADIMRQSIAYSIAFFSFDFIVRKKFLPFLLVIAIASLFHNSAWVLVLLYPAAQIKLTKRNILLVMIGAPVLIFMSPIITQLAQSLTDSYSHYLSSAISENSFKLGSVIKMLINIAVFITGIWALSQKLSADKSFIFSKEGRIYSALMVFMLLAAVAYGVSFYSRIFERIAQYFTVFNIIAIPQIFMLLERKKSFALILAATMALIIAYQIMLVKHRPDWNLFVPYEPFWENMDCIRSDVYYNRLDYIWKR